MRSPRGRRRVNEGNLKPWRAFSVRTNAAAPFRQPPLNRQEFTRPVNYSGEMPIDEEALKQFIASLPDLDKEHEANALGDDEALYIHGVLDAYDIINGKQPKATGVIEGLREIAQRFRVQHEPVWVPASLTGTYCKICQTTQSTGEVPWHSPKA